MEEIIGTLLAKMGNFLFGPIMLCVYFGVGLMFTIRLKGVQLRRFSVAFRECVGNIGTKSDNGDGQIKSFKALATALSSCVGNGNIVGVAALSGLFFPLLNNKFDVETTLVDTSDPANVEAASVLTPSSSTSKRRAIPRWPFLILPPLPRSPTATGRC